ncbi:MAG TPA: AMP-binding protein, partial [Chitinophagales bacterium]|nr:AMP-binding protein [Chitinophagales bacterium]
MKFTFYTNYLQIVDYTRIFDIIDQQSKTYPQEQCLSRREDKKTWTHYSTFDFIATANQLSQGLLKLGLQKGDTVAIISTTNRPEWHFIDLACMQIGVVDVPVYPTISSKEYEFIFNHSAVKYIFVSDKLIYRKIAQILPNIPSLKEVFSFDVVDNIRQWKALLVNESDLYQKIIDVKQSILPTDLATIIYTSGTTGTPKGVMLSHQNIVSNVKDCLVAIPVQPKEIVLSFLPLNHVFERTINYVYFAGCVSVYFADGLESISDHLQDIKPNYFTTVPRLLERVYEKIIKKGNALTGIKKKLFFWALEQARQCTLGEPKSAIQSAKLALANKL